MKTAALELGVPVYEPADLRAFAREFANVPLDLFALASYGRILPRELLALARMGALNVHPSLLPKYRGATPIQSAIRNGESETGVTVMLMDEGMDTGDVVGARRVPIGREESYGELHDRLAAAGGELLGQAIDAAAAGRLAKVPQSGEPSVTRPLRAADLQIDWSWEPRRIVDAVRAYSPSPAARADIDGESVKLLRAHLDENGSLRIDELVAPNRGRTTWEAYVQRRGRVTTP